MQRMTMQEEDPEQGCAELRKEADKGLKCSASKPAPLLPAHTASDSMAERGRGDSTAVTGQKRRQLGAVC